MHLRLGLVLPDGFLILPLTHVNRVSIEIVNLQTITTHQDPSHSIKNTSLDSVLQDSKPMAIEAFASAITRSQHPSRTADLEIEITV